MQTQLLGRSFLQTSRLAYGCWRLVSTMDPAEVTADRRAEGVRAVIAAYEAGYTLFDHADIYCRGVCESVFGDALRQVSGMRDRILIGTKCGIVLPGPGVPHRYDFSPDYIQKCCEASLQRLGVETIDLYQLHRPDFLMNPAAVAEVFAKLRQQGKVREFGVSNFAPTTLTALQKALPFPLVVNQVEISLAKLDAFSDGTLDQCLAETITPLVWSPLGGGTVGTAPASSAGSFRSTANVISPLQKTLAEMAKKYDASEPIIAMAWLLKHPSGMVPIVGSIKPNRIREALKADAVNLSGDDWYRLMVAARGTSLP